MVEFVYSNGAYRLAKLDDEVLMVPINGKFLKSIILRKFPRGNRKNLATSVWI